MNLISHSLLNKNYMKKVKMMIQTMIKEDHKILLKETGVINILKLAKQSK